MSLPLTARNCLREYREVQFLAKRTFEYLRKTIRAGMSEKEVRAAAEEHMLENGADGFWYHGVGAFVLAGERSVLSMSGKEYIPSVYKLKETDLVTVDLSPRIGEFWGDYARTLVLKDGVALGESATSASDTRAQGWLDALAFEESLHTWFVGSFNPDELVSDAFARMQAEIREAGYKNLDFNQNLGHTIERAIAGRRWLDEKNQEKMGDWQFFTFEPHLARSGERYGFKHENIYHVDGGRLVGI